MSKLVRKTLLQFGSTVNAASEIGQYGSYASPIYTADIAALQAGTAWPRGWAAETAATNRPFLEDMNAIDYVYGYMLCYLLQEGLAEWDSGTTYYQYSRCQYGGVAYVSLQDTNLNRTPGGASSTYWQALGDVQGADIASASSITLGSDGTIFKITGTTTVNTINNPNGIRVVRLSFSGILTLTSAGNVILNNGNFVTAANSMITLVWNGSSWLEASRSPVPAIVGYGSPVSKTIGSIYQASTDGIVRAYIQCTAGNQGGYLLAYCDSSPTPTSQVGIAGACYPGSGQADHTVLGNMVTFEVKKGNYYQVTASAFGGATIPGTTSMTFTPSGT